MSRPVNYKTKQSQAILSYLASLGDAHITAGEIAAPTLTVPARLLLLQLFIVTLTGL